MKVIRPVLSLLLAILLVVSVSVTAFAAEEDEDLSVYVYHHNVTDDDYDGPNLQYFSPYVTDFTFDDAPSYIQSNIFSLYNTLNGEVVPVYCTDIQVGAFPDHRYRRLNLEDSTFAASAAGHLRAIMLEGFYIVPISGESVDAHAVRVAEKLQELGKACGVEDLTIGEAISGTQTAIWQAAHGSRLKYTDFVRTIYTTKMPSATRYYDLCNEERINGHIDYSVSNYGKVTLAEESDLWLNARIKAVYDYLLSLEPVAASSRVVSPASFVKLQEPAPTMNGDGTYDVTVNATVDVDMAAGDSLTLRAKLDADHTASTSLNDGRQSVSLTLENVPAEQAFKDVTLTISGNQTVSEVFLYDAYGDRETAQSMIGMDDSQVPVRASVTATTDRILNFYKTTSVEEGSGNYVRRPLEGITFDLYFVASMDDYLSGAVQLPEPEDYDHAELAEYTVITDANGRATLNFTQHGLPDGVYLVVEREHPAIVAPVEPFYVFVPTTKADGSGYDYEVTIQPKNDVKGGVHIEKDVTEIGNDETTVDAYANHTWIIGTTVPEDIGNGKSFVISDNLDPRLDYMGNLQVRLESVDGETVFATLTEGTDYTLTVTDVDSLADGTPNDAFTVELTRVGMGKLATAVGGNSFSDYMLRVYFDAQINANAEAGAQIPNKATLDYTNSVNFDFSVESDEPVVYTGGVNLLKVDAGNHSRVLPGAVFRVYRKATAEEVAAGGDAVTHISGVSAPVVRVSFFDNEELTGDKVTEATSDENGKVAIYGLAYGEYYLVEAKAPNGYNLIKDAVTLTVDATSHTGEKTVTVENFSGAILPSTGGIGTPIYFLGGTLLLSVSVLLLYRKKREFV